MAARGGPPGVLLVSRRVAHSAVAKKVASRFRVQIVSEGAADFVLHSARIAFSMFELDNNISERNFEALIDQLCDMRDKFERSVMLLLVPHSESLELFQRLQRTYLDKFPLLIPCVSADKAAGVVLSAIRIASGPEPAPPAPLTDEEELQLLLQGVPCLRREDIKHLVLAFGSLGEFARNIHDQELDLLLGPECARATRDYFLVNRPAA